MWVMISEISVRLMPFWRAEAAVAQAQEVVAAPYLSEEDVVVQAGKLGGELAQLVTSGCLYNFLLCHTVQC